MQIHPTLRLIGQWAQSLNALAVEVQLGRILDTQRYRLCVQALQGALAMRLQQVQPVEAALREKTIARLRLRPTTAGPWKTRRRAIRQALGQQHRAGIQALVTQFDRAKFLGGPAHRQLSTSLDFSAG